MFKCCFCPWSIRLTGKKQQIYQLNIGLEPETSGSQVSALSTQPLCLLRCYVFFSAVNECEFVRSTDSLHPNDPCLHQCENLLGSYRCYCKDGYRLTGDRCEGNKWQISSCQLSYRPGLGCWKTGWHYPVDSVVCFANTYPLDTDQSRGKSYPSSEQLGPEG